MCVCLTSLGISVPSFTFFCSACTQLLHSEFLESVYSKKNDSLVLGICFGASINVNLVSCKLVLKLLEVW